MSERKSLFEARDRSPGGYATDSDGHRVYSGPERRQTDRRTGEDRRIDVRFELAKQDRRKNHGRRQDDKAPKFW